PARLERSAALLLHARPGIRGDDAGVRRRDQDVRVDLAHRRHWVAINIAVAITPSSPRQEQERHVLSNQSLPNQTRSSYTLTLPSRTRQPTAQPHGSGIRVRDPRGRHGARERRASEGGGLRKCRRWLLSES